MAVYSVENVSEYVINLGLVDNTQVNIRPGQTIQCSILTITILSYQFKGWLRIVDLSAVGGTIDATDVVLAATLKGLNVSDSTPLSDSNSLIQGIGKLQGQLNTLTTAIGNKANISVANRANHTGTQSASTIHDLTAAIETRIQSARGRTDGTGLAGLDNTGHILESQLPTSISAPTTNTIVSLLNQAIGTSELSSTLLSRINLIDGTSSVSGSVNHRLAQESAARTAAISVEATTRDQAIVQERSDRNSAISSNVALETAARQLHVNTEVTNRAYAISALLAVTNRHFFGTSAPSSTIDYTLRYGDEWTHSTTFDKYVWNNSAWVIANAATSAVNALRVELQGTIASETGARQTAIGNEASLREALFVALSCIGASGYAVYQQESAPSVVAGSIPIGSVWSNASVFKRWSGSTWVDSTANKRAATYLGPFSSPPSTTIIGDLYLNIPDDQVYVWTGSTWTVQQAFHLHTAYIEQEARARAAADAAEAAARAAADLVEANARAAAITAEASTRAAADSTEQTARINADAAEAATRANADTAEQTARVALASQLRGGYSGADLSALSAGLIYDERTARTTNDNSEAAARVSGDLAESAARQSLSTKITGVNDPTALTLNQLTSGYLYDERAARIAGDATESSARGDLATQLRGSYTGSDINSVSSGLVGAERTARVAADSTEQTARETLSTKIFGTISPGSLTLGTLTSGLLYDERTARSSADTAEQSARISLSTKLTGVSDPSALSLSSLTSGLLYEERALRESQYASLNTMLGQVAVGASDQFDYSNIWYFDSTTEGWTGPTNPTAGSGYLVPNYVSGQIESPTGLAINSISYTQVRMRVRKTGTPTWNLAVYWKTSAGVYSSPTVIGEPTWDANGFGTASINVAWSGTVDRIKLVFSGLTGTNYYSYDWIAVGRASPGASASQVATEITNRISGDSANTTLTNSLAVKVAGTASFDALSLNTLSSGLIYEERTARIAALSAEADTRAAADAAESTARAAADAAEVTARTNAVSAEAATRAAADTAEASIRNDLALQIRGTYTGVDASLVTSGLIYSLRNLADTYSTYGPVNVLALLTPSQRTSVRAKTFADNLTAALTAIVTAAAGRELYFPDGGYLFDTLTLSTYGQRISGDGARTQLRQSDTSQNFLVVTNDNVTIQNVELQGSATATTYNKFAIYTSTATAVQRLQVLNVRITGKDSSSGFTNGIKYDDGSGDGRVENCYFDRLIGTASGFGYGVQAGAVRGLRIRHNTWIGASGRGRTAFYLSSGANRCQIVHNHAENSGFESIAISSQGAQSPNTNNTIAFNTLINPCTALPGSSGGAISIAGHALGNTIGYNTITGSKGCGIKIDGTGVTDLLDTIVVGNQIYQPDSIGVDLVAAIGGILEANKIKDASYASTGLAPAVRFVSDSTTATRDWMCTGNNVPNSTVSRSTFLISTTTPLSTGIRFVGNLVGTGTVTDYELAAGSGYYIEGVSGSADTALATKIFGTASYSSLTLSTLTSGLLYDEKTARTTATTSLDTRITALEGFSARALAWLNGIDTAASTAARTTLLQTALNNGGLIIIPPGTWTLNPITASHADTTIVGEPGAVLSFPTLGSSTKAITVTGNRLTIRGLKIQGPAAGVYVSNENGIHMVGTSAASRFSWLVLDQVEICNFGAHGVYAQYVEKIRISDTTYVHDCGYAGIMLLSCANVRATPIVHNITPGTSGNMYGLSLTHDSTGYDTDPNAGLKNAANPFTYNAVIGGHYSNIAWEAIDTHGAYEVAVIGARVYATRKGISLTASSGSASNYAGWANQVIGCTVDGANIDGTTSGYEYLDSGITLNGATTQTQVEVVCASNIVRRKGIKLNTNNGAIIAVRCSRANIYGNIIDLWNGNGINVTLAGGIVSGNFFGPLGQSGDTSASCILDDAPGSKKLSISNNLHDPDTGNAAPVGFKQSSGSVKPPLLSGNDFRACATPFSLASASYAYGSDLETVINDATGASSISVTEAGGRNCTLYLNAAGSYSLVNLTGGTANQVVRIMQRGSGAVTVTRGSAPSFRLDGSTNKVLSAVYSNIVVQYQDGNWTQVSPVLNCG